VCVLLLCLALGGCRQEDSGAYGRGMEALEAMDYETALEEFQQAAETDGREAEAYRGMGIVYLEQGRCEEAAGMFGQSLEAMNGRNDAFREDVLYYQAEAYRKAGQNSQAEEVYQELAEGSRPGLASFFQGEILLEEGDAEQAEELFRQAAEEEESYEMDIRIYEAYAAAGREADGAAYLRRALELTPADGEDYYQEGRIYYYLEDFDAARTSLSRSWELGKEEAALLLGRICLEAEDIAGARALYQEWLQEDGSSAFAYNGLALCDIAEGNYDSALVNVSNGLSCGGEAEEELLFNEIVAYEYKLDFDTAKEKMKEFLEKYPGNQAAVRENRFLQSR
jgi:tetratricopeptide (TPR) repeat protein